MIMQSYWASIILLKIFQHSRLESRKMVWKRTLSQLSTRMKYFISFIYFFLDEQIDYSNNYWNKKNKITDSIIIETSVRQSIQSNKILRHGIHDVESQSQTCSNKFIEDINNKRNTRISTGSLSPKKYYSNTKKNIKLA